MKQHERQAKTSSTAETAGAAARTSSGHKRFPARTATEAVDDPLYDEKFDSMRCALCHDDSERWYAFLHRGVMFFSGLSGAGSVALFLQNHPSWAIIMGFAVTVLTTLDLVFDLSGKARLHAGLKEQFYVVLSECEGDSVGNPKPHRARLTRIYGIEPPVSNALNYLMWNKAYLALSRDPKDENLYHVGWLCKVTRHIFSHEGRTFITRGVKNGSKKSSKEEGSKEGCQKESG